MPANISFSMTTPQFIARTKIVTRRTGWQHIKVGSVLQGVEKAMGLKKVQKIKRLGLIRVTGIRREPLDRITDDMDYGRAECILEGFPPPHFLSDPRKFCWFFMRGHGLRTGHEIITRIEFEYLEEINNE